MVWEGCTTDDANPAVINAVVSAFVAEHRGYRIKEWVTQTPNIEALIASLNSGGLLLDADGSYVAGMRADPREIFAKPFVLGLPRQEVGQRVGSWMSAIFMYEPPKLGLRPGEQRLLRSALGSRSGTDEELANELAISVSAVKKTWRSIYERTSARAPELLPSLGVSKDDSRRRGKEKKQRLLAYVRAHPEELRPGL
jgi:DNA-binding CsgD family transcriptional regulator